MRRFISILLSISAVFSFGDRLETDAFPSDGAEQEIRTYFGTSIGGMLELEGTGEGDVYLAVIEEPVKGDLELREDGSFLYTPRVGKLGRDSFGIRVIDGEGENLREILICVNIMKQRSNVVYEDMRARPEGYAAACLAEKGLFVGEKILGQYCFFPEKTVTKGEFLSICMHLSGRPLLRAVCSTGFADDAAIPVWMKSYVFSAALQGIEIGCKDSFQAGDPLSCGQAAEIAEELLRCPRPNFPDPNAPFDRASMACFLLKYLENSEK